MDTTHIKHSLLSRMARPLCRTILCLLGWRIDGGHCNVEKAVVLAVPHTSNWDLFFTLLSGGAIQAPVWFMMKHTHFWWPLNILWRCLGGIPINRTKSSSVVTQMVQAFNERDRLMLIIPPEGTRKQVTCWKTGFYHIAQEANVPVWPWFINYERKRTGSGPLVYVTGDIDADFARIRAYYEEKVGPMPECRPKPPEEITSA